MMTLPLTNQSLQIVFKACVCWLPEQMSNEAGE